MQAEFIPRLKEALPETKKRLKVTKNMTKKGLGMPHPIRMRVE